MRQLKHARSPFCRSTQGGALTAAFKGLKQRFTFLLPRFGLLEALEAAKVCGVDDLSERLLSGETDECRQHTTTTTKTAR